MELFDAKQLSLKFLYMMTVLLFGLTRGIAKPVDAQPLSWSCTHTYSTHLMSASFNLSLCFSS